MDQVCEGDSLRLLTNLKELRLDLHHQPLGNSLQTLTNLETLDISDYQRRIEDSFLGLTKLKKVIAYSYPYPNELAATFPSIKFTFVSAFHNDEGGEEEEIAIQEIP